jgi:hypothetical protein
MDKICVITLSVGSSPRPFAAAAEQLTLTWHADKYGFTIQLLPDCDARPSKVLYQAKLGTNLYGQAPCLGRSSIPRLPARGESDRTSRVTRLVDGVEIHPQQPYTCVSA